MFSFMAKATSSMTVDQNNDFITTESFKSFLMFQVDDKWSECRQFTRKLKKR